MQLRDQRNHRAVQDSLKVAGASHASEPEFIVMCLNFVEQEGNGPIDSRVLDNGKSWISVSK